jgi:hypothetical protein
MFDIDSTGAGLDTIAHIIQVALTPVFLLSGIATLLGVFSTRLARVADQVHRLSEALETANVDQAKALAAQLAHLHRRSVALDVAVVLGALGGAATCGAVLTLFVGALREAATASVLFALFGFAVFCALAGICAFATEMLMASTGIRGEAAEGRRAAGESDASDIPEPQPDTRDAAGPGDGA